MRTKLFAAAALGVLVLGTAVSLRASADETDLAPHRERCAIRLSIALQGQAPPGALMSSSDPQQAVPSLVDSAAFRENFARFLNASFNDNPGTPNEDVVYTAAKYILDNGKPWRDLFTGQYRVDGTTVVQDANGLGYFRSKAWLGRYAGNDGQGLMLPAAHRVLQNTTGVELVAVTNAPNVDVSQTGRMANGCRGCHFDQWFALDRVAELLPRVKRTTNDAGVLQTTFQNVPVQADHKVLGDQTVTTDDQLLQKLVESTDFRVNSCRLAFKYLYGRPENASEGDVFDRCVDTLVQSGRIEAAVSVVAQDPGFCD